METLTSMRGRKEWTLLAYGGLALPLCLAEIPIVLYLPTYYARELHLGVALVGVVFLVARMWDGLSDVIVGGLSDRLTSRLGRRKPWVIIGAPFLMVSTWFLCNPPASVGFLYLGVWVTLFYASFTAVKIPHLSWGTELATDYVERSRVTTFREAFTMLGNLTFVSVPLIVSADESRLGDILFLISVTTLVAVPLTAAPIGLFVRDAAVSQASMSAPISGTLALIKNPILLRYLIARLLYATEEGIANSLLVFSFSVGLQMPNRLFWTVFILYITTLCTLPITLSLARRVEKHRLLAGGLALQAFIYGVMLFVPAGNFHAVGILYGALGLATTAMLSLPSSILADIIDHGELRSGERDSGTYVAVDNLVYKVGMALGVGLSFGLLGIIHFDPSAPHRGTTDMYEVRALGFGLPCVLSVAAMMVYLRHPITRKLQQEVRVAIEARKTSQQGTEGKARPQLNPGPNLEATCGEP